MNAYDALSNRQKAYVDAIIEFAPALGIDLNKTDFSRAELRQVSMTHKQKIWIPNWITHDQSRRVARGMFSIPEVMDAIAVSPGHETETDIEQDTVQDNATTVVHEPTVEIPVLEETPVEMINA